MALLITGLVCVLLGLVFQRWRTSWNEHLADKDDVERWWSLDSSATLKLSSSIEQAAFEGCTLLQSGNTAIFEVQGSAPHKFALDDAEAGWRGPENVPEMLAMFGLQHASWCLRLHAESGDPRWLAKFDMALDVAENEARAMAGATLFAWTEHAAALRLVCSRYCMRQIALLPSSSLASDAHRQRYIKTLSIHLAAARICSNPFLYDYVTNHGLITDNALLQCALTWPDSYLRTHDVIEQVKNRSVHAARYFVSPDGVPMEPATSYWYLIRRLLNDIKEALRQKKVSLPKILLTRLDALDAFLAETNMDGAVQRFGDSSGGNSITLPFVRKPRSDGVTVRLYDTGLLLMNCVEKGKVTAQMMVNGQDIRPRVHAQQDAGSMVLYVNGTFWINSPGSFTAMNHGKRMQYTSCENQSTVFHTLGYNPSCEVVSVTESADEIVALFRIGGRIERKVRIAHDGIRIKVTDRALDGGVLTTTLLLAPTCTVAAADGGFVLRDSGKELLISTRSALSIRDAYISYRRNEVLGTKSVGLSGIETEFAFELREHHKAKVFLAPVPSVRPTVRERSSLRVYAQLLRGVSAKKLRICILSGACLVFFGLITILFKTSNS